jgi:hypothetical protein
VTYPPSPYQPYQPPQIPQVAYTPPERLAPARRAAILMYVVSGLALLCGGCMIAVVWAVPMEQIVAAADMPLPDTSQLGVTTEQLLRIVYTVLGIAGFAGGLAYVILAIFVHRGSVAAIIISMIITALVLLWLALNVLVSLPQLLAQPLQALLALLVLGVPASLLVVLLMWLIQALRAINRA